ncbi:DNA glycosylase [Melanomma pulvis-pyrius CBS 109.77]|uniref:DNA glycosylase n=1 Tax=Melanomma pulvis-pyrius CBS 109.77 TaxID=1314802 RepID=A0A6A6WRF4_9PLEO|nr:DNA glycosylase [Melanomma pulvis-pyrius CBS 109.77]
MSLRRSTRLSANNVPDVPKTESPNGVSHSNVKKPSTATKKRKSKALAASAAAPTQDGPNTDEASFLTGIIKVPDDQFTVPDVPTTPKSKRRKAIPDSSSLPPPLTPTPSGVGLMSASSYGHPLENLAADKARPAEPYATNAPLSTPGGSRVVAYASSPAKPPTGSQNDNQSLNKKRKPKEIVPPDVGALRPPTSTTDTLLKDACLHLCSVDPRLNDLIEKHHCKMFSPEGLQEVVDPFTALSSGIIGQQVSGAAAASIRKKFTSLFEDTHPAFPSPTQVVEKDIATLRTAGLSQRKAEYIQGLAEKFTTGELSAQMLVSASDEDLIEKLVAVRGLGRWSVEMFACFGLKRMDVFSTGDLGVQRGIATYVGKDVSKLKAKGGKWKYMSEKEMLDVAAPFTPYRSLFMWLMWRIENVDLSVMQSS